MKLLNVASVAMVMVVGTASARADEAADRAALRDSLNKIASSASALAATAKASDDRGARKKFAPAASDLGDDLSALARRSVKDVPYKSLGKDAAAAEKEALALVELADEADDKDERKSLRAQANLIAASITTVKQAIDAAATKSAAPTTPPAPVRFTGRLVNNSDACSWSENVYFIVSANGQTVWKSPIVFPGKEQSLVLEKGSYFVQVTDTAGSKTFAQGNLTLAKDGWVFKTGCVNQD